MNMDEILDSETAEESRPRKTDPTGLSGWIQKLGESGMPVFAHTARDISGAGFFVTPIEIRGKVIGVFYAERQPSCRPLDEDSFASFKHFARQGNLALAYLSGG